MGNGLVDVALVAIAAGGGVDAGVGFGDGVAGAEAGVVASAAAGGGIADVLPAAADAGWESSERPKRAWWAAAGWALRLSGCEGEEGGGGVDC